MPILPHLGNQDAWPPPHQLLKVLCRLDGLLEVGAGLVGLLLVPLPALPVHPCHYTACCNVPPPSGLEGARDLSHGCACPGSLDGQLQQVGVPRLRPCRRFKGLQHSGHATAVPAGPNRLETCHLLCQNLRVVDGPHLDRLVHSVGGAVLVDADDGLLATVDVSLLLGGALLYPLLGDPRGDGLRHAASGLHLLDHPLSSLLHL
mmetsp:Transcript_31498/g.89401  ORF Transcript_31498/g.89401 Transcript_31498/m.89401 type:complete len:204 (+) Transcript_31498:616-1227(+)